jgi:hypothetical protein
MTSQTDTNAQQRRYENLSSQSTIQLTFQAINGNEACECDICAASEGHEDGGACFNTGPRAMLRKHCSEPHYN